MAKPSRGGGRKRLNSHPKKNDRHTKRSRNNHTEPNNTNDSSSSEEEEEPVLASEEEEKETQEPVAVYKEPSMYDNLLSTLSTGNKTLAKVCRQRRDEEEGIGDEEEEDDEDDVEDEINDLDEDEEEEEESVDDEDESDDEDEDEDEDPTVEADVGTEEEDDEFEEASDEDEIGESAVTTSTSSFSLHFSRVLSQEEIADLPTRKLKYKWQVPVVNSAISKWAGTGECFLKDIVDESSGYGMKSKLYEHWLSLYKSSGGKDFHSSRQRQFFSICNSYRDIMHCNKRPFYHKSGVEEDSNIRDAYIMHALNHVFRSRDLLVRNEKKLARLRESNKEDSVDSAAFLDRGFNRPKVLFLLPIKNTATRVVDRLLQLTPPSYRVKVEHMDSYRKLLGGGDIKENGVGNELSDNEESESQRPSKPPDYEALFGRNPDDDFIMGIKYTGRKMQFGSGFYSSDVIVASAMGIMGKYQEVLDDKEKEKDLDYLSSIEVLIIDHADVISMQNWASVKSVMELLNNIPTKQHGTDVMRIRQWYLDGHARFYRQTIVLGFYLTPEINSFFNHQCLNYQGKVKSITEYKGVLPKVLLPVRQLYERFDVPSVADADDARFDYFTKKVLPKINDSVEGGTMIFFNSYFEFFRVRNFLKLQNSSVCEIGDYTPAADVSRARNWFFKGERKIMLYTERFYFNFRYKIRGVKNLIFYSLPERKEFYPEIINMLEGSEDMSTTVLFSRLDQLCLERIVGKKNTERMMSSEKRIFIFC